MDYKAFSEEISRMVRPQSFPVGMKFVQDIARLPDPAVRPSKYGVKISLCQWTTMARRWGRVVGATAEDINCSPCLAALGLKRLESLTHLSEYFLEMGYFDSMELAEAVTRELDPYRRGK